MLLNVSPNFSSKKQALVLKIYDQISVDASSFHLKTQNTKFT